MGKVTIEQRLEAAIAVENGASYIEAGRSQGFSNQTARRAYLQYKQTGTITPGETTDRWPLETKLAAIEYKQSNQLSSERAGIQLGIFNHNTIELWEKAYMKNGIAGLEPKKPVVKKKEKKPREQLSETEKLQEEVEYLRAENAYLKRAQELMAELKKKKKVTIITELLPEHKLPLLLRAAKIARSSYYYHLKIDSKPQKYATERAELHQICALHKGRYGYRRSTMILQQRGYPLNHKVVMNLMSEEELTCKLRSKRYRSIISEFNKTIPDLLQRNFKAKRPNQKWVTDITEFKLHGQKLYLSVILDLYCREVVEYHLSKHIRYDLVQSTLNKALHRIKGDEGLILHSDQGWHYKMNEYHQSLGKYGIQPSMSRKGNCYDNCVIENFFGLLKTEFYENQKFATIQEFEEELVKYIEYYNNVRIKCSLGGMSPVDYRKQFGFTI